MTTFSKKRNGPWEKCTMKKNGLFQQEVHSVFTSRNQMKYLLRRENVRARYTHALLAMRGCSIAEARLNIFILETENGGGRFSSRAKRKDLQQVVI